MDLRRPRGEPGKEPTNRRPRPLTKIKRKTTEGKYGDGKNHNAAKLPWKEGGEEKSKLALTYGKKEDLEWQRTSPPVLVFLQGGGGQKSRSGNGGNI